MVAISRSALLPYADAEIFALVNDIAAYPQFLTGCLAVEILHTSEREVTARLELGKAGLRYAFTTRNTLEPPRRMVMHLVEGPFRHFEAQWQFTALTPSACKTQLDMQFEFSNAFVNAALRALFENTSREMVAAICQRAEHCYGRR
ncbi:MAG: type II toxin-antitoxin system RatA family toxin [Pseudomonadales bacterium]|jgi:ribosome-associated toxin RatA of RatAB toxin-antitoxin module|nr:type II toxin-antitoxin system RatA family toxin [Pseudomonadales bacterium]